MIVTMMNVAIMGAVYLKLDHALEPVVGMRKVLNVLTDELNRLSNRINLLHTIGEKVGEAAVAATNSKAATYVKEKATGWFDKLGQLVQPEIKNEL